jgi:hypothetical protein
MWERRTARRRRDLATGFRPWLNSGFVGHIALPLEAAPQRTQSNRKTLASERQQKAQPDWTSVVTDDQPDLERARKERSPSFPFISLERAIERLKEMADAHKRNPARMFTVGRAWGYGPRSSGLLQTVAALKAFGLTEDLGARPERRIQISDLGWRILQDARPGAREAAIREAAVSPRLIAEYAGKWIPDRPSDAHCLSELQLDRGFTETAANSFLRVFDETVGYANLRPRCERTHLCHHPEAG